jgi:hypothetical protein
VEEPVKPPKQTRSKATPKPTEVIDIPEPPTAIAQPIEVEEPVKPKRTRSKATPKPPEVIDIPESPTAIAQPIEVPEEPVKPKRTRSKTTPKPPEVIDIPDVPTAIARPIEVEEPVSPPKRSRRKAATKPVAVVDVPEPSAAIADPIPVSLPQAIASPKDNTKAIEETTAQMDVISEQIKAANPRDVGKLRIQLGELKKQRSKLYQENVNALTSDPVPPPAPIEVSANASVPTPDPISPPASTKAVGKWSEKEKEILDAADAVAAQLGKEKNRQGSTTIKNAQATLIRRKKELEIERAKGKSADQVQVRMLEGQVDMAASQLDWWTGRLSEKVTAPPIPQPPSTPTATKAAIRPLAQDMSLEDITREYKDNLRDQKDEEESMKQMEAEAARIRKVTKTSGQLTATQKATLEAVTLAQETRKAEREEIARRNKELQTARKEKMAEQAAEQAAIASNQTKNVVTIRAKEEEVDVKQDLAATRKQLALVNDTIRLLKAKGDQMSTAERRKYNQLEEQYADLIDKQRSLSKILKEEG